GRPRPPRGSVRRQDGLSPARRWTAAYCLSKLFTGKEALMRDDPSSSPSNPTRRAFLRSTGDTAAAAVVAACTPGHANSTPGQSASAAASAVGTNIEGAVPITLRIYGKDRQLRVDP